MPKPVLLTVDDREVWHAIERDLRSRYADSDRVMRANEKTPNVEVWTQTSVSAVHGDTRLGGITVKCAPSGETKDLPATSLFIFIGALPRTEWLGNVVERDDRGFILSGLDLIHDGKKPASGTLSRDPSLLETSVPGVFVVADVCHGSVKHVASEGAIVVQFMHQYLAKVQ